MAWPQPQLQFESLGSGRVRLTVLGCLGLEIGGEVECQLDPLHPSASGAAIWLERTAGIDRTVVLAEIQRRWVLLGVAA